MHMQVSKLQSYCTVVDKSDRDTDVDVMHYELSLFYYQSSN